MTPEDTVPQDARPPTPQPQPHPQPRGRTRYPIDTARGATRLIMYAGSGVVAVSALIEAFLPWAGGLSRGVWTFAIVVGAISVTGAVARIVLGPGGGDRLMARQDVAGVLLFATMAVAGAVLIGLTASRLFHDRALDHSATRTVTATVSDCRSGGDGDPTCTYHWTFNGVAHTQTDDATRQWPNGHETTVRINPSRPNDAAIIDPNYWLSYFLIAVGTLVLAVGALSVWAEEAFGDD